MASSALSHRPPTFPTSGEIDSMITHLCRDCEKSEGLFEFWNGSLSRVRQNPETPIVLSMEIMKDSPSSIKLMTHIFELTADKGALVLRPIANKLVAQLLTRLESWKARYMGKFSATLQKAHNEQLKAVEEADAAEAAAANPSAVVATPVVPREIRYDDEGLIITDDDEKKANTSSKNGDKRRQKRQRQPKTSTTTSASSSTAVTTTPTVAAPATPAVVASPAPATVAAAPAAVRASPKLESKTANRAPASITPLDFLAEDKPKKAAAPVAAKKTVAAPKKAAATATANTSAANNGAPKTGKTAWSSPPAIATAAATTTPVAATSTATTSTRVTMVPATTASRPVGRASTGTPVPAAAAPVVAASPIPIKSTLSPSTPAYVPPTSVVVEQMSQIEQLQQEVEKLRQQLKWSEDDNAKRRAQIASLTADNLKLTEQFRQDRERDHQRVIAAVNAAYLA